jgi:two-component system, LytTR family, response regulator
MKAIIVDDEPKAIELLQGYLLHFPQVELMSTFRNGLKALAYMQENPVDLVFLDINMPHLSGISLSKMLEKSIKVIFITAHAEYAPESYDVEAVDYLMKPVSFERFTKAIQKVLRSKPVVQDNSTANAPAMFTVYF